MWNIQVQKNSLNGDLFVELPDELIKQTGWKTGDKIEWIDLGDGSYELAKARQYVLVEAVEVRRKRYIGITPTGRDSFNSPCEKWVGDEIVCNTINPVQEEKLDTVIVSTRVISKKEASKLATKPENIKDLTKEAGIATSFS